MRGNILNHFMRTPYSLYQSLTKILKENKIMLSLLKNILKLQENISNQISAVIVKQNREAENNLTHIKKFN